MARLSYWMGGAWPDWTPLIRPCLRACPDMQLVDVDLLRVCATTSCMFRQLVNSVDLLHRFYEYSLINRYRLILLCGQ